MLNITLWKDPKSSANKLKGFLVINAPSNHKVNHINSSKKLTFYVGYK